LQLAGRRGRDLTINIEREQPAEMAYRSATASTGGGFLDVESNDVAGRLVTRRRGPFDLTGTSQITSALDMRRAAGGRRQPALSGKTRVLERRAPDVPSGQAAPAKLLVGP
jgi:hypothetical protein